MTKVSDNVFPRLLISEGGSTAIPAAGQVTQYAKADGLLYSKDDAGTETLVSGGAGGGGGTTQPGSPAIAVPHGVAPQTGTGSAGTASRAETLFITTTQTMYVRAMAFGVTATGAGTYEWGLFNYASNPAACTKLAGGSGVLGSTGYAEIAATGAPVAVPPGNYIIIIHWPASGTATIRRMSVNSSKISKLQASYTWDDTPDLTTGWSDNGSVWDVHLRGDLSGSGTTW